MDDDKTTQSVQGNQSAVARPGDAATVTIHNQYSTNLPPAPDPDARLQELPLDTIPEPGNLSAGSRVVHFPNPAFVGRAVALHHHAKALREGTAAVIHQNAAIMAEVADCGTWGW